ncbi:MAG TPA: phosphatidylserine/phosphatidylglycerophosphate/cardiolipin synthase family protein [Caulobacteraceae bacterium]|jgi:cardiolipin synthase
MQLLVKEDPLWRRAAEEIPRAVSMELLVGADAFWRRAAEDCARASRRLLVEVMTFEGDSVGQRVAADIASSPARDRRVIVDGYSRVVLSDQWARWPMARMTDALRAEKRATQAMFDGLAAAGVGVRVTNPVDWFLANYPARNHKKLIIADDVAYVGGINFSEHNFSWRDFMLRVEGADAVDFLAADFHATWDGGPRAAALDLEGLRLVTLDGRTNRRFLAEIERLLASARREVVVLSAYLTFPYARPLGRAVRRGVGVRLITPWENNKPLLRDYLLDFARRHHFEVKLLPEMSHLKGLLIDGEILVIGSCNFDFAGHAAEEELAAIIRDPALIETFRREVIDPAEAAATGQGEVTPLAGLVARVKLRIANVVAVAARIWKRRAVEGF